MIERYLENKELWTEGCMYSSPFTFWSHCLKIGWAPCISLTKFYETPRWTLSFILSEKENMSILASLCISKLSASACSLQYLSKIMSLPQRGGQSHSTKVAKSEIYFLDGFEQLMRAVFSCCLGQKLFFIYLNCSVHTKKLHKMKLKKYSFSWKLYYEL